MKWYIKAFRLYGVIKGRASRKEFWYFALVNFVVALALAAFDYATGTFSLSTGVGTTGAVYALITVTPGITLSVRRFHDINRSGWWFLIVLIPFIGVVMFLVWMAKQGAHAENRFGPSPSNQSGTDSQTKSWPSIS